MTTAARLAQALADRYRIDREIGAGGMATVFLAHDVRHDRPVALKVLNPELGAVLGVERFLAEIKVTANLQHPNLLPLFDSGEADGLLFYVMPFVEGESLRARLDREKQFPIDEAVRIGVAVANALDYAHQQHVIHRDLKPENVLMQAGQPVVADFGIALAVSNAGGNRITQTGLSLGTPQYMSPEQATGDRVIDGRTDIYSLGAIVYEMLTGEPPHLGTTSQAIIARLLTERPHGVRTARPAVPEYLEAAVARALEKLPADRFTTAREFAEALQGRGGMAPSATTATQARPAEPARPSWGRRLRDPLVLALGATTLAAGLVAATLARREAPPALRPIRFVLSATDSTRPQDNFPWPAAISPDGGTVVFTGPDGQLWSLRTDQLEPRPIPGTSGGYQPFFSPNGEWVGFAASGKERKVRLDGSAPVTISDGGGANGVDWTARDDIVLGSWGTFSGLSHVSAAGGQPEEFTHPDSAAGDRQHAWPIIFPDDRTVVFTIWSGSLESSRLALATIGEPDVTRLDIPGVRSLAVLDGHVVYVQADGTIMAIPVDAGGKRVAGKPVPVHDPVPVLAGNNGNSGAFASRGGALVTARGGVRSRLVWVGRDGRVQDVMPEARSYASARVSPDQQRIAVVVFEDQRSDIWIHDGRLGTFSRLTNSGSVSQARWSSDGQDIIYTARGASARSGVWRQRATGGAPPEMLAELQDLTISAELAPDGRSLLVTQYRQTTWDIMRIVLDSGAVMQPWLTSRDNEVSTELSPDGRWAAVVTDESGRSEVYVRSFPDPSVRVQVSAQGGTDPTWSDDGSRLFYRSGAVILAARVTTTPSFTITARDTVITAAMTASGGRSGALQGGGSSSGIDVSRDGNRFLGLLSDKDDFQLVVSPNWITEFRSRIAAATRR